MTATDAEVTVRPLRATDEDLVFAWRNDPFIVQRGSSQRAVDRSEHAAWFARTLIDPNRLVFIVEIGGEPAGQVRLDRSGEVAVMSVYLLERFTGGGRGVRAIELGCDASRTRWPDAVVIACVRDDNVAGQRAFEKAGFHAFEGDECPAKHRGFRWP